MSSYMHLCAVAYLALPVFIVLFTILSIPFVLLSAVALIVLVCCLHNSYQHRDSVSSSANNLHTYWPLLLISLVVTYACVVFPYDVIDWQKNFAVFNALIESTWPPIVEVHGQTWFLRYYLAWYAVPALFAKICGAQYLPAFIFIWTATGVFSALLLAFHHLHRVAHLFLAATIFFLLSGLDIFGVWIDSDFVVGAANWPHTWSGFAEMWAALAGLYYAPQHMLGGWIAAGLFLRYRDFAVKYSAVIIAVVAMWSPFCAIGIVPLAIWAITKENIKSLLTPQNLIAAPCIVTCVAIYLVQGAEQIPFMFIWHHPEFSVMFLVLFIITEFLLLLGILYLKMQGRRDLIITLALFLLLACLLSMGVTNDWVRVGSTASLCMIAILMVDALLHTKAWSREILVSYFIVGALPVVVAFAKGMSIERVDEKTDFAKFTTSIYTYEEHPYNTWGYLVKTSNALKFWGIPVVRYYGQTQ